MINRSLFGVVIITILATCNACYKFQQVYPPGDGSAMLSADSLNSLVESKEIRLTTRDNSHYNLHISRLDSSLLRGMDQRNGHVREIPLSDVNKIELQQQRLSGKQRFLIGASFIIVSGLFASTILVMQ